jgi:hypothetical protein
MSKYVTSTPFNTGQKEPNYFNTNTSHPIIKNAQEYIFYKKYVSIHSEDRDMLKFPHSSEFEIEMPEDMLNVASVRLFEWTFPANYNTFSLYNSNIFMTFLINKPYNPNENNVSDILTQNIFECLYNSINENFLIVIEEGFYNPQQMVTELTNKFNTVVTNKISLYFLQQSVNPFVSPERQKEFLTSLEQFQQNGGYTNFVVAYNNVGQKIWFGNTSDGFTLTNETSLVGNATADNLYCGNKSQLPDFSSWGLPCNIGLPRCNSVAMSGSTLGENVKLYTIYNATVTPRFFYGDVNPGDNGYWLLPNPNLPGSEVWWVEAGEKINLMGSSHFYMELEGQNCIDETSPYNLSSFTSGTNGTNGVVNSSFAKISVPTTPLAQWFDKETGPYKYYLPPAERMRKLKIKLRYHNGLQVNFGVFNYSFTLEFTLQVPQILRDYTARFYPPII